MNLKKTNRASVITPMIISIAAMIWFFCYPVVEIWGSIKIVDLIEESDEMLAPFLLGLIAYFANILVLFISAFGDTSLGIWTGLITLIFPIWCLIEFGEAFGFNEEYSVVLILISIIQIILLSVMRAKESVTSTSDTSGNGTGTMKTLLCPETYTDEYISEVLSDPAMYSEALVEGCKVERNIRDQFGDVLPKVESWEDTRLVAALDNPENYSPVVIRCAKAVLAKRRAEKLTNNE